MVNIVNGVRTTTTTRGDPQARTFAVTRERETGAVIDIREFRGGVRGGVTTRRGPTLAEQRALAEEKKQASVQREKDINRSSKLLKESEQRILSTTEIKELTSLLEKVPVTRVTPKVTAALSRKEQSELIKQQQLESERTGVLSEQQRLSNQKKLLEIQAKKLQRQIASARIETGTFSPLQKQIDQFNKQVKDFEKKQSDLQTKAKKTETKIAKFKESTPTRTISPELFVTTVPGQKDVAVFPEKKAPTIQAPSIFEDTRPKLVAGPPPFDISKVLTTVSFAGGEQIKEAIPRVKKTAKGILDVQAGLASGAFGAAFDVGQDIVSQTPEQILALARQKTGLLKQPSFFELLLGDRAPGEVRRKIVDIGKFTGRVVPTLAPGAIGLSQLLLITGESEKPGEILPFVAAGGLFAGAQRFLGLGAKAATLLPKTVKGRKFVEKGFVDIGKAGEVALISGVTAITGAELAPTLGTEQAEPFAKETAQAFSGFLFGARAGGRIGTQVLRPTEATIARAIEAKRLSPKQKQTFKDFFELSKEFKQFEFTPRELNLRTERLTTKEANIVEKILKENSKPDFSGLPEVALFGSGSLAPQVPKRVARTLKKPEDVDIAAINPSQTAAEIVARLRAGGTERLSMVKGKKGVVITKAGKKIIEVKFRSGLIENFEKVRGVFELPTGAFVRTPSGIALFKLSAQAKRQAIGGALEQPNLRQKDLIRLEQLSKVLTPAQIEAAAKRAAKKPAVQRLKTDIELFLGEQRAEFLPGQPRALKPIEPQTFFEEFLRGKPSRPRRLGGVSRLPVQKRAATFLSVSKLPSAKETMSRLLFGEPSRLPVFVTSFFPPVKEPIFTPSRLPPVGVSKLPPVKKPPRVPSRLPPVQPIDIFAPVSVPSVLPPEVPSKVPPTVPSRLPPTEPIKIPPGKTALFFLPKTEEFLFKSTAKKVPSFNVFVKTEPFTKKKFTKVNPNPLSKRGAIARGILVTDNTISQTFKIKKGKKRIIPKLVPFLNLQKVRQPKNKPNVFIERRQFAIDTLGEVNKLRVSKFLAQEKRKPKGLFGTPKKRKRKTKKKKFKKQTKFFAF